MFIAYLLITVLLYFSPDEDKNHTIYIAKSSWHVGIILQIDECLPLKIDAIQQFDKFQFVDIGWGDAEFYQSPDDFDLFLAAKAILLPTPSVLRIHGYKRSLNEIMNWRDFVFEVKLDCAQFNKLCFFINNSFEKDSTSQLIQTSEKYEGIVRFYSSIYKYHAVYTCNTWVAEALEYSGMEVLSSNVITADELFIELSKCGIMMKID